MYNIIKADDAYKLSEIATEKYTQKVKEDERNQWLKDLEIIKKDLNNIIEEDINDAIEKESNGTNYCAAFIISTTDLLYADEYNYYHHIILKDYSKNMVDELIDRLLDIVHNAGYKYKCESNKPVDISPKLKLKHDEPYFSLTIEWFNPIDDLDY